MQESLGLGTHIRNGIAGSLVGGIVMGMLMSMMGMMEMIAMIVRSESLVVGWIVHLVVSFIFGIVLGLLLAYIPWNRVLVGTLWGIAAWIGGALILMPIFLGMPGMVFNLSGAEPWMSMMGHILYGLIAGVVALWLERRTSESPGAVAQATDE